MHPSLSPTHYDTLQLPTDASTGEVREAWRRLAARHHPDRVDAAEVEAMSRINQAYEVLSDPHARARYDAQLWPRQPLRRLTLRQSAARARRVRLAALVLLPLAAAAAGWGLLREHPAARAPGQQAPAREAASSILWLPAGSVGSSAASQAHAAAAGQAAAEEPLRLIAAPRIQTWAASAQPLAPPGR